MTKQDIVEKVATELEFTKKDVELVIDTFLKEITNSLSDLEKVVLSGFGTFEIRERQERTGRNPKTGEEMHISAKKTPGFKPGKLLKEAIK
ncbi:MAG: HU family DNA-binding protein [Anaeroplasmataceae bacterium]